ncbi:hypothetical protein Spa11_10160 [Botrimarina mediterranea]|uniref:Uncharacterized protein n=1 Tax=Botrimarina mediterranea TaxID=2528022 RepID=A0A518K4W1_9BACT|nr:hypothetical protein Spa11_10160 [Botrimarina mediterranea]
METDSNSAGVHRNLTGWWWTTLAIITWLTACNSGTANEPPKPIEVSVETTFITEPIASDGLPDYAGAVLNRLGRDVKPEDNGAVILWRAVGVDLLNFQEKALLFTELRCDLPRGRDSLKPLPTLRSLGHGALSDARAGQVFGSRPWRGSDFPGTLGMAGGQPSRLKPTPIRCEVRSLLQPLTKLTQQAASSTAEYQPLWRSCDAARRHVFNC